jgi:hypothetical protein
VRVRLGLTAAVVDDDQRALQSGPQ